MRTLIATVCLFLFLAPAYGMTLAEHGHSDYVIVIAKHAGPAVVHGAKELSADLKQMSGATIPVIRQQPKGPAIYVGASSHLPAAFKAVAVKAMPPETVVMRTSGHDLYLNGQGPRGALYAVYTFLEDELGVGWYGPKATVIPTHAVVKIPALNKTQTPAFRYRDVFEQVVFQHAQWDAHLRLNGKDVPDKAKLGGNYPMFNGSENFYQLVPPKRYFAKHPEYYSLINGKRTAAPGSQLCLSNPAVFKIIVHALVAKAKANPKLLTLGLSPNDSAGGESQDAGTRALLAKYGTPSGVVLNFVNRVAKAVQAHFPHRKLWVETLAYQYTQKAPPAGVIKPAKNVLVCLAPIGMDNGHPLATYPGNATARKALLAWSEVAPGHLQVWQYVTNFSNYLQPFPDWDELGVDMAYYKAHGVSGLFCEGDYQGRGAMAVLHTWIIAHLLWNPHQNVWSLIRKFCNGYYGKAGPDIYAYLRLFHKRLQQPGVHLGIYASPNARYLSPHLLGQANALFDKAQAAVAGDAVLEGRVEEARMGIEYVYLQMHRPGKHATKARRKAFAKKLNRFLANMKRFHSGFIREGGSRATKDWVAGIKAAAGESGVTK